MSCRNNIIVSLLACILSLVFITSCQSNEQEELLHDYYLQKVSQLIDSRREKCDREILEKAEEKADSFFLAYAKRQPFDSSPIPHQIERPSKPKVEMKEDSLPIAPLIPSDSFGTAIDSGR